MNDTVMLRLMEDSGLLSSDVKFTRVHINGGYFRYMMEVEHATDTAISRFTERTNRECIDQASDFYTGNRLMNNISHFKN